MDYRDYFTDDAVFEDSQLRRLNGRDNLIQMLNRLRPQATNVEWQVSRANIRNEGSRQIVENVPYIVYSGAQEIGRGLADFYILREPDWKISYWKDTPDGMPFFDPF
jgi:limonene-1,2-epoxide hydrolase